jgi:hypothetical protein
LYLIYAHWDSENWQKAGFLKVATYERPACPLDSQLALLERTKNVYVLSVMMSSLAREEGQTAWR